MSEPSAQRTGRPARRPGGLFVWTLLAGLVLLAALAGPALVGCVYTHDDLGAFHLPLRAFYSRQLARGEPFDWMPQLFSGFYLSGEGQAGTYHPLHLLLYRFLPLPTAMACELLASYPFMLAGMYLFLRRHLLRSGAAMFGALVFTFSGFNLLHFVHPNAVAVVAHIPWMLWLIHVLMSDPSHRRVAGAQAGIALLTGSQLLLGYPQYVWFSLLAEMAYAGFLAARASHRGIVDSYNLKLKTANHEIHEKAREMGPEGSTLLSRLVHGLRKQIFLLFVCFRVFRGCFSCTFNCNHTGSAAKAGGPGRPWCRLAFAKAVGLMLGAVQLLPTCDALANSARRSADAAFLNAGSLHPLNLVQLVAPYLFSSRVAGQNTHELGLYLGAVPLMLIVWLLVRPRALGRLQPLALGAAGFGLLALVLAFGKYAPLYPLQRFLPLVGGFRFPCRYLVLFYLAAATLSAIAMVTLARRRQPRKPIPWNRLGPLWVVVVMSVLAAILGLALSNRPFIASAPAVLAGPLLIGSAAVLVALAARGSRKALVALVLLAAADLGYYGMSYATYPHTERLEAYLARAKTPPTAPDGRVLAAPLRFGESTLHTGNQITLAGWHRADGYAGLEPARQLDYRMLPALRAAGVRWVSRNAATATIAGLVPFDDHWLQVPEPLDRVRLLAHAQPTSDPARDVARIFLEATALIEDPLHLPSGSPGTAAIVHQRPGRLDVRVTCPTTQLLVISESYHPGWKAAVDGRPEPVLRANGDFLGCVVPPGEHNVVLEFRPTSLRAGLVVSCLGLVLLSAFVIGHLVKPVLRPPQGSMS